MNGRIADTDCDTTPPSTLADLTVRATWRVLRWTMYGLLSLLRPVLIPVLTGVAVGSVLLWVIFVLAAHDAGFPSLPVLGTSIACALTAVLYQAAIQLLAPDSP